MTGADSRTDRLTELRCLAQTVLEGPEIPVPGLWGAFQDDDGYWSVDAEGDGRTTAIHNHITYGPLEATHRYIAAASPSVILSLLDELDQLRTATLALLEVIADNGPRFDPDHPEDHGVTPAVAETIRGLEALRAVR